MRILNLIGAAAALVPAVAGASETVTYSYDVKGRLTQAAHSGSINNGMVASYVFDAADNRTQLSVTGSALNSAPVRVVVVPLGGLKVIPLTSQ